MLLPWMTFVKVFACLTVEALVKPEIPNMVICLSACIFNYFPIEKHLNLMKKKKEVQLNIEFKCILHSVLKYIADSDMQEIYSVL